MFFPHCDFRKDDDYGLGADDGHGDKGRHGFWVHHVAEVGHGPGANHGAEQSSKPVVFVAAIDFALKIT